MPFVMSGGNPVRRGPWTASMQLGLIAFCLSAGSAGLAQIPQPAPGLPYPGQDSESAPAAIPKYVPPVHTSIASQSASQPGAKPQGQFPSDAATQPAKVMIDKGKITVEANNSDLAQILNQVASLSGIAIKGMTGGPRVFGVYGPGDAREVLTALLNGSGYNFIMIGGAANGPPKELLLTPRVKPAPPLPRQDADNNPNADDDADPADNAPMAAEPPPPMALPPPDAAPTPPLTQAQQDEEVRKTLERLKVIHDHQQDAPVAPPD